MVANYPGYRIQNKVCRLKLLNKLTLFITLSKLVIVLLFVGLLPKLVHEVAARFTDNSLREQQKKVVQEVAQKGIDFYLQGEENYGSYTLLKEEYISLEPGTRPLALPADTIETAMRIVEGDTLNYRVLTHTLNYQSKPYILEIGKQESVINRFSRPLQKIALSVLIALVIITILADLIYTRFLLKPLGVIIRSKLINTQFPFTEKMSLVKTSTSDFQYLDQSLTTLMEKIHRDFEKEREFTSNASHELMTPITILQNRMENLLSEGKLEDEAFLRVEGMMKTLNRLKQIVRSLMLISRIENDQYAKKDIVKIRELLNDVIEELHHRLEGKGLSISLALSSSMQLSQVNRDLLFQLFYNIINNAIRYNKDNGRITISDSYILGEKYLITISDTGIGIAVNEIASIFERFRKSAHSTEESHGLGLSIVKSIADYHDITLQVRSTLGQGSEFDIVFPWQLVKE